MTDVFMAAIKVIGFQDHSDVSPTPAATPGMAKASMQFIRRIRRYRLWGTAISIPSRPGGLR